MRNHKWASENVDGRVDGKRDAVFNVRSGGLVLAWAVARALPRQTRYDWAYFKAFEQVLVAVECGEVIS